MTKILIYINGFRKYSYLMVNLVKRDITTKYRRSMLGIAWSVLNPLMMMLVITAVFENLFRFSIEHFPIYYLTGSLIYTFTVESTSSAMSSILNSSALVKKVYIPKYIFPLQKCVFALVNALFFMAAIVILFFFLGFTPSWTVLLFPIPLIYTFVFCVGLGMLLCTVNIFFRDTGHLYSVWVVAWMYLTPIIYPVEILPDAVLKVVRLNPLYYYVEYFRMLVLYGELPGLWLNLICIFFSVTMFLIGLTVFKLKQDKFILHI